MTTTSNDQPSETRIKRAERAIKEAEQAYQQATDAPRKLQRSYESELETINKTLEHLGLETPVDEVIMLLNRRAALSLLIQASEKNVRPSRDEIDEAIRQRDHVIRQYHRSMESRAIVEQDLEYREVVAACARGDRFEIPYLWLRKRRTNSRQTDGFLRKMIEQEIKSSAQNTNHFNEQKLIEVREKLQQIDRAMEELGGDRLKTERLNWSY